MPEFDKNSLVLVNDVKQNCIPTRRKGKVTETTLTMAVRSKGAVHFFLHTTAMILHSTAKSVLNEGPCSGHRVPVEWEGLFLECASNI